MDKSRLNENQRRRISTHLSLLAEDIALLARSPDLRQAGEAHDAIQRVLFSLQHEADSMRATLSLPPTLKAGFKQRLLAFAGVWSMRTEDLRPSRLTGYGKVDGDLHTHMDPHLDELRQLLLALTDLAAKLPDP